MWAGRGYLNRWEKEETPGVRRFDTMFTVSQHFLDADYTSDRRSFLGSYKTLWATVSSYPCVTWKLRQVRHCSMSRALTERKKAQI